MENAVLILLAEDEPLIAMPVAEALEDGGYAVRSAPSGTEALSALEAGEPLSALVTDINVGAGPDGWELARRAREINPAIAVVYMSADSGHKYSAEGVPDSIILQKPFAPDQVVTAVSTLLNQIGPAA